MRMVRRVGSVAKRLPVVRWVSDAGVTAAALTFAIVPQSKVICSTEALRW